MVSIEDVERLEHLYATGQKVKAISECRELALTALPGHSARLTAGMQRAKFPIGAESNYERHMYARINAPEIPEDNDAAMTVTWCAKWLFGQPDTRTEFNVHDKSSKSYVVHTRDDFATNAFISLGRMAAPVVAGAAKAAAPLDTTNPSKKRKGDLLAPLVIAAQKASLDPDKPAAVFAVLLDWAQEKHARAPLVDVNGDGSIIWNDSNGKDQNLTLRLLAKRLKRQNIAPSK